MKNSDFMEVLKVNSQIKQWPKLWWACVNSVLFLAYLWWQCLVVSSFSKWLNECIDWSTIAQNTNKPNTKLSMEYLFFINANVTNRNEKPLELTKISYTNSNGFV